MDESNRFALFFTDKDYCVSEGFFPVHENFDHSTGHRILGDAENICPVFPRKATIYERLPCSF